jgi:hypothetical protein
MPFHDKRIWSVKTLASGEELIDKLANHCWCLCCGFRVGEYLFLNDATHGDGAQEFAVIRHVGDGKYRQIESWTVSWMNQHELAERITGCLAGEIDDAEWSREVTLRLQTPEEHKRCPYCS